MAREIPIPPIQDPTKELVLMYDGLVSYTAEFKQGLPDWSYLGNYKRFDDIPKFIRDRARRGRRGTGNPDDHKGYTVINVHEMMQGTLESGIGCSCKLDCKESSSCYPGLTIPSAAACMAIQLNTPYPNYYTHPGSHTLQYMLSFGRVICCGECSLDETDYIDMTTTVMDRFSKYTVYILYGIWDSDASFNSEENILELTKMVKANGEFGLGELDSFKQVAVGLDAKTCTDCF